MDLAGSVRVVAEVGLGLSDVSGPPPPNTEKNRPLIKDEFSLISWKQWIIIVGVLSQ